MDRRFFNVTSAHLKMVAGDFNVTGGGNWAVVGPGFKGRLPHGVIRVNSCYDRVEPGDVQRAIGTVLIGAAVILALYAAELQGRLLRVAAALILTIVAGVVSRL